MSNVSIQDEFDCRVDGDHSIIPAVRGYQCMNMPVNARAFGILFNDYLSTCDVNRVFSYQVHAAQVHSNYGCMCL